jgi:tetratricopeptide (TPR) repeat protein
MTEDKKSQAFLSYASENLDMVRKVYEGLVKRKLNVWFDKEHLGPGRFKPQIEKAIRRSRYFIICLSNAAIKKTGDTPGFQDHELNEAYEIARNLPEQEFTIIPVRLEECHRGDHRLTLFQQYDLFSDYQNALDKLAVHTGGISLSDNTEIDDRTDDEKLIYSILAKANAEYWAGKFEESVTLVNSILTFSPKDLRALFNKGAALTHLGKFQEAIDTYDQVLKIKPDNASVWVCKGITLENLGKFPDAIDAFQQAFKIIIDHAHTLTGAEAVIEEIETIKKTFTDFEHAMKNSPNYTEVFRKRDKLK